MCSDKGCADEDFCTIYPIGTGFEQQSAVLQSEFIVGNTDEYCAEVIGGWESYCGGNPQDNVFLDKNVIGWKNSTCYEEWIGDGTCGMYAASLKLTSR